MSKYEITFDHVGDKSGPSVMGQADTMKEAKALVASIKSQDVGTTIWTEGRKGYVGLVADRIVFHVRIEVAGIVK